MSKSYAKVTAELFSRKHPLGTDTDPATRFTATQRAAYKPSNFRRWVNEPEMRPQKDYDDYSKFVNENHVQKKQNLMSATQKLQLENKRSSGARSVLLTPSSFGRGLARTAQEKTRSSSIDQAAKSYVKPRVLESRVSDKEKFFNLSDGFKRIFSEDKQD